ncbi:hypothetical protein [Salmonirosea aquatica]
MIGLTRKWDLLIQDLEDMFTLNNDIDHLRRYTASRTWRMQ